MRKMQRMFALTLMLIGMSGVLCAQENTEAKVDSLEARVNKIEKFSQKLEKVRPWLPKITGYMGLGYYYTDKSSTFEVRNVRADIQGELTSKFDYRWLVDLYKFKTYDARFRYKPLKELSFCAGQFKVPFSIGNLTGPLTEELIDYPLVTRQLVQGGLTGESTSGRDVGVALYGNAVEIGNGLRLLDYSVGVFNGNGMNFKDNNKSKDVSGRLTLHPVKGMSLAGSYYWGEKNADYMKYNRWSVGGEYKCDYGVLRGEYVAGETGAKDSEGWFALVAGKFTHNFMGIFRMDSFTSDKEIGDTERNYTVGIDYRPLKFLWLKANYTHVNYNAAANKSNDNQYKFVMLAVF